MEHVKTAVQAKVSAGISTTHKLMIGIIMVSAFSLGLSFAGLAINVVEESQTLQLDKKTKIPRPAPLMVDVIYDANTNNSMNGASFDPRLTFYSLSSDAVTNLGDLDLVNSEFTESDPWGINLNPEPGRLQVWLNHSDRTETKYFSPSVVSLYIGDTSTGLWTSDNVVHLCIPGSNVASLPVNQTQSYNPTNYYFAADGTPYIDQYLTRMAMSEKCPQLLDRQARYSVEGANFNGFAIDDFRLGFVAGSFELAYNTLSWPDLTLAAHPYPIQPDAESFSLEISRPGMLAQDPYYNTEAGVVTIEGYKNGNYGTWHLCLPESIFDTENSEEVIRYFYDVNGTPYTDPFYKHMVIPYSCQQIVDKGLLIGGVVSIQKINSSSFSNIERPYANFYKDTNSYSVADFNLITGILDDPVYHYDTRFPEHNNLLVHLTHNSSSTEFFEAQKLDFAYFSPNSTTTLLHKEICWPDVAVPYLDPVSRPDFEDVVYFYYDNDGKPYRDALLLQPVNCKYIPSEELPDIQTLP